MLGLFIGIFGVYAAGVLTCEVYGRYVADGREAEPWKAYFYSHPWVIVYTTLLTTVLLIAALSACASIRGKTERYLAIVVGLAIVLAAESMLIYKKKVLLLRAPEGTKLI